MSQVKVQYDYDAASPGDLSIRENQILFTFGPEDAGWLLVQAVEGDGAGYIPANYVHEVRLPRHASPHR